MAQGLSVPPLTHEEFVSLQDCAKGLMHRAIPAEQKDRLIQLGCLRPGTEIAFENDVQTETNFSTGTHGFASPDDPKVAVLH